MVTILIEKVDNYKSFTCGVDAGNIGLNANYIGENDEKAVLLFEDL